MGFSRTLIFCDGEKSKEKKGRGRKRRKGKIIKNDKTKKDVQMVAGRAGKGSQGAGFVDKYLLLLKRN